MVEECLFSQWTHRAMVLMGCWTQSQFSARLPYFGTSQKLSWLPFLSLEDISTVEHGNMYNSVFITVRWVKWVTQWFTEPDGHRFKLWFCSLLAGCPPMCEMGYFRTK